MTAETAEDMNPRAVLGANNPPPDLPYDPEKLKACGDAAKEFADAAGDWAEQKQITSAEQAEKATDFIAGARKLKSKIEATQKAAKKPHADKATAAFDAFKPALAKIEKSIATVLALQGAWLVAERRRVEEEQRIAQAAAQKARDEAAALLAAAQVRNDISGAVDAESALKEAAKAETVAAKPVKVSAGSATGGGRTVSLRTYAHAQINNQNLVYMHFRDHPDVRDVLQRLATAAFRAAGGDQITIPGATRRTTEKAA